MNDTIQIISITLLNDHSGVAEARMIIEEGNIARWGVSNGF